MPLIDIIAGARPNFIKIAAILHALKAHQDNGGTLQYRLIHTGQHYDSRMSDDFFNQLEIPQPDFNLGVGSGTQAEQTGRIMLGYEQVLQARQSDLCMVVGDVTSTMACAVTAQKIGVQVAHVEAGIRSGDWRMPEEINRIVTDSITNLFFTTSRSAGDNLRKGGVTDDCIYFVGNTMIDTLLRNLDRLRPPDFWDELELETKEYFVITLHRPANVDAAAPFTRMLEAIAVGTRGYPVIFPVHPRTAKILENLVDLPPNLHIVDPQPYLEFNHLVRHAKAVITDSGGITEETTMLGVPCLTLRDNTERPETISVGTNELIGTNPAAVGPALDRLFAGKWKKGGVPENWDGKTGERIVTILDQLLGASINL
jgi:UDP-N-acetylglucosamine 2-epimerase (non-hydrolysing)